MVSNGAHLEGVEVAVIPAVNGTGRLLTVSEVAGFLQVKVPRIYELVRSRRLRAVRVGRLLRVTPRELERFLEDNATQRERLND